MNPSRLVCTIGGALLLCAEHRVLGLLPGIVGTLQGTEPIELILGKGGPLVGRLLYPALMIEITVKTGVKGSSWESVLRRTICIV